MLKSIRKTEQELISEGFELLQENFWILRIPKKPSYFKCIIRCSKCSSLLDFGEQLLEPGQVISVPECENCGTFITSMTIQGRESVAIKKII